MENRQTSDNGQMKSSEKKNTFVEDEKIINEDESNAVFLNLFFFFQMLWKIWRLQNLELSDINPLAERISNLIFKAFLKYKKHSKYTKKLNN